MNPSQQKKIAILVGRDPSIRDDTDGGSVFMEYLIKEFRTQPVTVDIFIPRGISGGIYNESRAQTQEASQKIQEDSNVSITYVPIEKNNTNIAKEPDYFLARIEQSERFAQYFKDGQLFDYDLVYILHVANAFSVVAHKYIPLERTILFPMMTSANYSEFSSVPQEYIENERKVFQSMRHICCPSDDEIQRIMHAFDVHQEVLFKVHRGFDAEDFPAHARTGPYSQPGSIALICANGIRPQKDHLFLLSVLEELVQARSNVRLHLTGNNGRSHNPVYNAYTDLFWKTAAEKNLREYIISHDILPRAKLVELLDECDAAVYPSKSETFGKSALESVVSGIPTIVCDDIPAYKEFIEPDVSGIISVREPKAYASDILRLMADRDLYGRISASGIALRNTFTWKKVMEDLVLSQAARGL